MAMADGTGGPPPPPGAPSSEPRGPQEEPGSGGLAERPAPVLHKAERERLAGAHVGLATYLARRFANRGRSLEDLTDVALAGLSRAADTFDPAAGVDFATHATTVIVAELKRHLHEHGWTGPAPRRTQELYLSLSRVVDRLSGSDGDSPTIARLAVAVDASEEEVLEALEAGQSYRFADLSLPHSDEGARPPGKVAAGALSDLLRHLPPQQAEAVRLRFVEHVPQSEIARRMGTSQMQMSLILSRSVAQLRSLALIEGGTGAAPAGEAKER